MFARTVKVIAVLTVVMSVPLLLSYNVKYQKFPEGLAYLFLYVWWLISIWVTPVLLTLGFIIMIWILASSDTTRRSSLLWNLLGLLSGVVAEVVLIVVGRMPTSLTTIAWQILPS